MKLYELLEVMDENIEIWVNICGEHAEHYDGKSSIDESYNRCPVVYITFDAKNVMTVEIL